MILPDMRRVTSPQNSDVKELFKKMRDETR
jgi:hypothetical protein